MTEEEMQAAIAKAQADADARVKTLEAKTAELLSETKAEREKRRVAEEAQAAAQEAAEKRAAEAAAKAGDVEAVRQQLEAKHAREIEAERKAKADTEARLNRFMIDGGIRDAMAQAGVAPTLAKGAALAFRDGRRIEVTDDGVSVDGVPLAQAVTEWASSDDGSPYKAASQSSGGGAPGGGGGTGRGLSDMTEAQRMALAQKDPAALRAMAGRG